MEQEANGEQKAASSGQNGRASPTAIFNPYYTGRPRTPANGSRPAGIDRQEIIRRIKSGESRPTSPELERPSSRSSLKKRKSPSSERPSQTSTDARPKSPEVQQSNEAIGMEIERPRSAFHRGDFREKEQSASAFERFGEPAKTEPAASLSTSPVAPWHPAFPTSAFRQTRQVPSTPPGLPQQRSARSRAVSNVSLASSFIYKAPTSPLVQASRPDTPEPPARRKSRSPDKSRRHTFSPHTFQNLSSALDYPASERTNSHTQPPVLRAERTFPYQAHQPRRSLHSFASLPQTPAPASRRPSFSESPLHHAPMVGSYEESILRGRMSTTPSKPLNFVAQIGVLGRGDHKPRCPPHATVPFPAVFYSYGAGSRPTSTTDQPSPYVGLVDLENNLHVRNASPDKRKQRLQAALSDEGSRASSRNREEGSASDVKARRRRRQKQKRRSGSPRAPPGGSYRIPQQGQLQIVIKNPNKTAVKLFLVPYDLSDMEPGQKTFIRQRSYSAGPIIDMPLSSRKNLGTDRPEASLNGSEDPNERPTLRYLVHLHICCPSKGRYFLYKSVRVVFANRVPDGKEKLRNEIQLPEPKYSVYKPGRDSNVGVGGSATPTGASLRRSAIGSTAPLTTETTWPQSRKFLAQSLPSAEYNPEFSMPMQPMPFHINTLPTLESRPASRRLSDNMDVDSEQSQEMQSNRSQLSSPTSKNGDANPISNVKKLDDPFNFERDRSRERTPGGRSESLLSRRLRDLAFRAQANDEDSVV